MNAYLPITRTSTTLYVNSKGKAGGNWSVAIYNTTGWLLWDTGFDLWAGTVANSNENGSIGLCFWPPNNFDSWPSLKLEAIFMLAQDERDKGDSPPVRPLPIPCIYLG